MAARKMSDKDRRAYESLKVVYLRLKAELDDVPAGRRAYVSLKGEDWEGHEAVGPVRITYEHLDSDPLVFIEETVESFNARMDREHVWFSERQATELARMLGIEVRFE